MTTHLVPMLARPLRPLARVRYRVGQFTRGLRGRLSPADIAEVRGRLSDAEFTLFLHAQRRDRRHSVDLYRLLQREGVGGAPASEAVLVAALLHDVGKGQLATWHRVAFVVLNAATPWLSRRLESQTGAHWRRGLWRLRHHAALGAEMLRRAGTDPRVVAIVEAHTRPTSGDPEVEAFIRADDRV